MAQLHSNVFLPQGTDASAWVAAAYKRLRWPLFIIASLFHVQILAPELLPSIQPIAGAYLTLGLCKEEDPIPPGFAL